MSVNSPQPVAAPTAPSRAAKAAVATAGEGFDAMVTNAVTDAAAGTGDKAPAPTTGTSIDAAAPEVPDVSSDADRASDETNVDAGTAGLLNGAALFVIQPQPQTVSAEADASGAIDTDGAAKTGVDLLQTAPTEDAPVNDASKASAQPASAPTTATETAELFAAALNNGAPQSSDLERSAEMSAEAEAAKESATLPASAPSPLATAQIAAPRLAASAFGNAVSNAAAGSAKVDDESGDGPVEASDPAMKRDGKTASGSSAGQAAIAQVSTTQSQTAATSAFAAQMQAQAQSRTAESGATSTDTLPTGQSLPAQQAALTITAPIVTSFSSLSRATLETTVQIAAQITRQLAGRSTRFEMGLTPEGLGKVHVSMDIDADGQLTARLAFDNPLAAADLRARADELRTQLQDAGFKLADDALTFSQQDASTFSDGGPADQQSDRSQNRAFASASRLAADADAIPPVPAWVSLSLTPRGVDMKV